MMETKKQCQGIYSFDPETGEATPCPDPGERVAGLVGEDYEGVYLCEGHLSAAWYGPFMPDDAEVPF